MVLLVCFFLMLLGCQQESINVFTERITEIKLNKYSEDGFSLEDNIIISKQEDISNIIDTINNSEKKIMKLTTYPKESSPDYFITFSYETGFF